MHPHCPFLSAKMEDSSYQKREIEPLNIIEHGEVILPAPEDIVSYLKALQSNAKNINQRIVQYQEIMAFVAQEKQAIQQLLFREKQEEMLFHKLRHIVAKRLAEVIALAVTRHIGSSCLVPSVPAISFVEMLMYWKLDSPPDLLSLLTLLPAPLCSHPTSAYLEMLLRQSTLPSIEKESLQRSLVTAFAAWRDTLHLPPPAPTTDTPILPPPIQSIQLADTLVAQVSNACLTGEIDDCAEDSCSSSSSAHTIPTQPPQPVQLPSLTQPVQSSQVVGITPTLCDAMAQSKDHNNDNDHERTQIAPSDPLNSPSINSSDLPTFLSPPWRYIPMKSVREVMDSSTTPEYQHIYNHMMGRPVTLDPQTPINHTLPGNNNDAPPVTNNAAGAVSVKDLLLLRQQQDQFKLQQQQSSSMAAKIDAPAGAFSSSAFVRKRINWGKVHSAGSDIYSTMQQSLASHKISPSDAANNQQDDDQDRDKSNVIVEETPQQDSNPHARNQLFSLLSPHPFETETVHDDREVPAPAPQLQRSRSTVYEQHDGPAPTKLVTEDDKTRFVNSILQNVRKRRP